MTLAMPWDKPIDVPGARAMAMHLAEYACDGSRGRPELGDEVYEDVTERRDFGAGYSSCADLAHWMLFRLGVRDAMINRKEHRGWVPSVNLSRIAFNRFSAEASNAQVFAAGDIIVMWNRPDTRDGHVAIVLRHDGDEMELAQYGAPGGKITTGQRSKMRKIHRWIDLGAMLTRCQQDGCLIDAEDPCLPPIN